MDLSAVVFRSKRARSIQVSSVVATIFAVFPPLGLVVYLIFHHNAPSSGSALFVSVENSVLASVIALVMVGLGGIPLGFYLYRNNTPMSRGLAILVRLPLGVPPLVAGVMLLVVFGPNSPIGHLFGGRLTNTFTAIVIAQAFAALPYVIEGSRGAFGSVDSQAQVVASSLKMGNLAQLTAIFIPLAWSPIRSALLLGYLRAFGEFGAILLVAYSPLSLPIYTYVSFEGTGLGSTAVPIAVTLVLSGLVAFAISKLRWPSSTMVRLCVGSRRANHRSSRQVLVEPDAEPTGVKIKGQVGTFVFDINFEVRKGCTVLLGPSGSGKTITLNALAGHLETGCDLYVGRSLENLIQGSVGYVPQRFSLWPHLTLSQNLGLASSFGSSFLDPTDLLGSLDLAQFANRFPPSLSGGQYQRGALARALASNSTVVLLDEPLSALDVQLRASHLRMLDTTIKGSVEYLFVVTHDVTEAAYLADWLVVVASGTVLQEGPSGFVLNNPVSPQVAAILGADNAIFLKDANQYVGTGHRACFFSSDVAVIQGNAGDWHIDNVVELGTFVLDSLKVSPWNTEARFGCGEGQITARLDANVALDINTAYRLGVRTQRLFVFE